ncbi:MAG: DegV family protein, partial [Actinomycetota bacterium]
MTDPDRTDQHTALIVDSTALLGPELVARTGAIVVPVTVTIDGVDHLDGVDIEADEFYRRMGGDDPPPVATAQPAPGAFLDAYRRAAAAGATSALAVLVGSAFSGTVDSARLGAEASPIPVECVDTGQASFGVGLCALEAAEALADGASPADAAARARARSASIESVFIVQAIELARASGRFDGAGLSPSSEAIPVLRFAGGELTVTAEVDDLDAAVEAMAAAVVAGGRRIRVASGLADLATKPVTDGLEQRLDGHPLVAELLRYRVGPAVAATVGPRPARGVHQTHEKR